MSVINLKLKLINAMDRLSLNFKETLLGYTFPSSENLSSSVKEKEERAFRGCKVSKSLSATPRSSSSTPRSPYSKSTTPSPRPNLTPRTPRGSSRTPSKHTPPLTERNSFSSDDDNEGFESARNLERAVTADLYEIPNLSGASKGPLLKKATSAPIPNSAARRRSLGSGIPLVKNLGDFETDACVRAVAKAMEGIHPPKSSIGFFAGIFGLGGGEESTAVETDRGRSRYQSGGSVYFHDVQLLDKMSATRGLEVTVVLSSNIKVLRGAREAVMWDISLERLESFRFRPETAVLSLLVHPFGEVTHTLYFRSIEITALYNTLIDYINHAVAERGFLNAKKCSPLPDNPNPPSLKTVSVPRMLPLCGFSSEEEGAAISEAGPSAFEMV